VTDVLKKCASANKDDILLILFPPGHFLLLIYLCLAVFHNEPLTNSEVHTWGKLEGRWKFLITGSTGTFTVSLQSSNTCSNWNLENEKNQVILATFPCYSYERGTKNMNYQSVIATALCNQPQGKRLEYMVTPSSLELHLKCQLFLLQAIKLPDLQFYYLNKKCHFFCFVVLGIEPRVSSTLPLVPSPLAFILFMR
jgi:hypothetical protein